MADQSAPEYLTVRELAELLRIKERKVYELASSGEIPVSRVTGKLLFPEREIRAWISGASSGGEQAPDQERPAIFLGSNDPLLEWALRQSRCGLATRFDGSLDGLSRFAAGEGMATGLHLRDADGPGWNLAAVEASCAGSNAVLVSWAVRSRGLVTRQDDAGKITGVADLRGRVFAPRRPETGTQALFDLMCREAGFPVSDIEMSEIQPSENDAVLAVAQGRADVAFGLACFAKPYGLNFVALVEERFDLLVDRRAWFSSAFQQFMAFCYSGSFRNHAAEMAGYDVSELGKVRWNA